MTRVTLGIDTSCYTTSAALAGDGRIISSYREPLAVDAGKRGLRQSEAVFKHALALPRVIEEALTRAPADTHLSAVCASARPRDTRDSYMPVFALGASFARALAASHRAPYYETSHQQGHVRAALVDSGLDANEFIAMHLSGGTTEILLATRDLRLKRIGGTSDLNAGQLVDRVGVKLGLPFPAGPSLEALARTGAARGLLSLAHAKGECSFSGAEAHAMRLIDAGGLSAGDIAAEVYSYLARAIAAMLANAVRESGANSALMAGGVASSMLLRELLPARLAKLNIDIGVHWARPELSGDNACGAALIGDESYRRDERYGSNN